VASHCRGPSPHTSCAGAVCHLGCGPADEGDELVLETLTFGGGSLSGEARIDDPGAEVLDVVFVAPISGVGSTAEAIHGEVAILTVVGPLHVNLTCQVDLTVDGPSLIRGTVGSQSHSLHIHTTSGADHGPGIA